MLFFDADIVSQPVSYYEYVLPVSTGRRVASCTSKKPPKIEVSLVNKKVRYDTSKSSKQLERFKIDTVSPYGADVHTKISGLTSGKIGVQLQASISYSQYPNGQICMWYDEIFVKVVVDPLVYIAKEHKNNRCRYNVTLKHELKHVSVDRRTAKEYLPKIESAVKKVAKKVGTVALESKSGVKSAKKGMINRINKEIEPIVKSISLKRHHRQQVIDSKREYDLLSKKCGGKFN